MTSRVPSRATRRGVSVIAAGVMAALMFVGIASATTLNLPAANLYQPTAFGDSQVYSLELLNLIENNNKLSQKSQFNVTAAEGQIKDLIVIGTGPGGQSSTNTPGVSDDAYATPNGNGVFFNTRNSEPTNGPAGDLDNSWEISIASLITYLTDPVTAQTFNLVFLVDSNQEGNDAGQTQFFWARIQGVDATGNNIGGCFDLTSAAGDGATCAPITTTDDSNSGYPAFTGSYVENAGDFCVSVATGVPYAPPCAAGDFGPVSNNLGSNNTEFAVYFPLLNTVTQLQALLAAGAVNISVEFRFNNTDGFDTIWLCDRCTIGTTTTGVPGPAPLLLVGSGMLGVGVLAWRQNRRQV
jgi:hypothetical protein